MILTCFQADERKDGGSYVEVRGRLKKIDEYRRRLVLTDGAEISFDNILEIRCEENPGDLEDR